MRTRKQTRKIQKRGKPVVRTVGKPVTRGRKRKALSPSELNYFRKLLEAKKADLLGEVNKRLQEGQHNERVEVMDAADQALDAYENELHYDISDAERKFLEDVDEALKRIAEGTFGLCVQCGQPISKERLKAMPSARLCIACKQAQEHTHVSV